MEEASRGRPESGTPVPHRQGVPGQVFEVRVTGLVPESTLQQLAHVEISFQELRTSLRGHFRDQAELHGFLATLRTFGLDVVEVRRLAVGAGPEEEGTDRS